MRFEFECDYCGHIFFDYYFEVPDTIHCSRCRSAIKEQKIKAINANDKIDYYATHIKKDMKNGK